MRSPDQSQAKAKSPSDFFQCVLAVLDRVLVLMGGRRYYVELDDAWSNTYTMIIKKEMMLLIMLFPGCNFVYRRGFHG